MLAKYVAAVGTSWLLFGTATVLSFLLVHLPGGLSSAFTVLFAWLVLRERPAISVLAGAAVACAGVVTLSL